MNGTGNPTALQLITSLSPSHISMLRTGGIVTCGVTKQKQIYIFYWLG